MYRNSANEIADLARSQRLSNSKIYYNFCQKRSFKMLRKLLQLLTLIGRLFHNLCEWMDHERAQGALWSSLILSLIIVLLLALGCASPVYNNSKSQFAAGYGQGENYNRSAASNLDRFKNVGPQLEALAAAEQDASRDVNKLLWFSAGAGGVAIIGPLGAYAGNVVIGKIIDPFSGVLAGFVVGATGSLFFIDNYDPDPPSERLVGKSPEYVDYYTKTYKSKAKSIRKRSATVGCLFGGCLLGFIVLGE